MVNRLKRGRLDTVIEVLEVLGESSPTKRADIMARANVNHRALMLYLRMLEASGLVDSVPAEDRRTHGQYLLTPKGFAFLNTVRQALSVLTVSK
jgi:predicted transcriptional regulator